MKLHIYLVAALLPVLSACGSSSSSETAEKTAAKTVTAANSTASANTAEKTTGKPVTTTAGTSTAGTSTAGTSTAEKTTTKTVSTANTTASTSATKNVITVYKSPTCSCCHRWVNHLKANGFTVKAIDVPDVNIYKQKAGIAPKLASCHTAFVNGYIVEGHVPASDIKRMLTEKPAIKGISVPAMPAGTPGMEMGGHKDPYDVVSFDKDGKVKVYKSYR